MVRRRLLCAAAVAAAAIASLAPATPVAGSDAQPSVVSAVPSASTPHAVDDATVANAAVHTFTQVGGVMYAGGQFHSVQDPRRTTTFERHNLFSFDVATGQPTDWAPQVNGEVFRTLYVAPYLYVGGSFTVADGVQERLVRYRVDVGHARQSTTRGTRSGSRAAVSDLEHVQGRLIVAGAFKKQLIALDPSTGEDTGYLDLPITGSVKRNGAGPVEVYRIAVDPAGTRLVGIGNFTTVGTASRARAFMLDLGRHLRDRRSVVLPAAGQRLQCRRQPAGAAARRRLQS